VSASQKSAPAARAGGRDGPEGAASARTPPKRARARALELRATLEHHAYRYYALDTPTIDDAERLLSSILHEGDVLLTLGAGDIDRLAARLVEPVPAEPAGGAAR